MKQNTYKGILIALDGPNGVGKSTIVQKLKEVFVKKGYDVYATKEPTENELGDYVRSFSEKHKGISLACLVAGDQL